MEVLVGVVALLVALWQLNLQKKEIVRTGKVSTLVHMATVVKDKIDRYEKIIAEQKGKQAKWKSLADRVNNELRPLLDKLNKDILETTSSYDVSLTLRDTREITTQKIDMAEC